MTEHVQQPRLCADCQTMIHAKAEQAKPDQLVPWVCDHNHGGGNHVVAVAFTRGNAIVSWNVQGPLTMQAALAAIGLILASAEKHHMSVNPVGEQH